MCTGFLLPQLTAAGTLLLRRLAKGVCEIALANNNFIDGLIDAVEIQAAYENARVGNANDLVRQVLVE